ncbi:T9SS type A sorting domain-containing protein [Xanthomarina gelatinilytica]|uniref:T9SS type A sorting domain-containing protein n=1 Tax=Xanthomarina gelatinilytica TaxID=1137281 RepID=UPI003AA94840
MKTKLLYLFLLLPVIILAQTPITNYYSVPGSHFALVTSGTPIDQSATGTDLTWNFNTFTQTDTDIDTYTAPNGAELSTFPGTTTVLTVANAAMEENKIYTANVAGQVSITGISRIVDGNNIVLNYNTTNALIGTFPMSYGTTNSGTVAGTFTYVAASGTFTGTIDIAVDASGTLNINNLGEGAYSGAVTRLKTMQNLSLTAFSIPNIGTATQTTYTYYDNSTGMLVFRTTDLSISVPFIGINESVTLMESLLPLSTLNTTEDNLNSNGFSIVPNPVGDVLNIHLNQKETIRSITVIDMSGRQVLSINDHLTSISVSNLKAGIYFANIVTDKGAYSKKILKK